MALAGLAGGEPARIWAWPFHYYQAVRNEYIRIVGLVEPAEEADSVENVAPGVSIERFGDTDMSTTRVEEIDGKLVPRS